MGRDASSLRQGGRHVAIFTTASLPWMTGTAVNPALRAAYLAKQTDAQVTLVIPWLVPSEQHLVYPSGVRFEGAIEQEAYVRRWIGQRTQHASNFKITFYAGRYDPAFMSIFPVGDLTSYVPDEEADVAVLEEPEHLTWFHHGIRWTSKFVHVTGIVHTNYVDYARRTAPAAAVHIVYHANRRMTNIHCHKVIKLSDAVQALPRSTTMFVHGVPRSFLEVGDAAAEPPQPGVTPSQPRFTRGGYFIGKGVWGKGYPELLKLLAEHKQSGGEALDFNIFGSGADMPAIKARAEADRSGIHFHDGVDHLDEQLRPFRVFVNPSTSDVVATTTAEALAMGKWVICADHPSNAFFKEHFDNCLTFSGVTEFSQHIQHAQAHDPAPLSLEQRWQLTWEAATDRFLDCSTIAASEWPGWWSAMRNAIDWRVINTGTGIEWVRHAIGAGRNTHKTPHDVHEYDPGMADMKLTKRQNEHERFEESVAYHQSLGYHRPRAL